MIILSKKLRYLDMDIIKIKKTFKKKSKIFFKSFVIIYIFMKNLFSPIKDRIKQKYVFVKFFLRKCYFIFLKTYDLKELLKKIKLWTIL